MQYASSSYGSVTYGGNRSGTLAGNFYSQVLVEVIVVVDTITRVSGKVYSEVLTIVDTIKKELQRAFSEVVTIVDTFTRTIGKMFSEVVTIVEATVDLFRAAIGLIFGLNKNTNLSIGTRDEVKKGLNKNTGIGQGTSIRSR